MKIYKEKEIKNPLYIAVLENGITLFVYDGYGEGSDGCIYLPVTEEKGEGECEVVGWKVCALKTSFENNAFEGCKF